jgi:hypothetical protein
MRVFFALIAPRVALSAEKGAETTIYLATAPELDGVTGKYFDKKAEKGAHQTAHDVDTARKLWEASAQLVKAPEFA